MADPRVVILVPRREGFADRDALWQWTKGWWQKNFPDWPVVEGHHLPDEGLFNRSCAINRAASAAGYWDCAVIIDADVICDPARVKEAVQLAMDRNVMVMPFTERHDLNERGSYKVMHGYTGAWKPWVRKTYTDMVSSVVCVSYQLWEMTEGFDENFRGWGFEDNAFACAATTFGGEIVRLPGELWHMWHKTAPEGKRGSASFAANKARAELYHQAMGNKEATRALRHVAHVPVSSAQAGIPRILHRVVPEKTSELAESYWRKAQELHPDWQLRTWRDPLDPAQFPLTSPHWHKVANGAQLADLVRLEVLWNEGGVYIDQDVEPYRSFNPLLPLMAFAAWEDRNCVPNAVLGASPRHPAIKECLDLAIERMSAGTWEAGPGVTTQVLTWRDDVLILPPGSLYPYHYKDAKKLRGKDLSGEQPWAFCAHHWWGSWLPENKRW